MSCIKCDHAQGALSATGQPIPELFTYVRVGNANVYVSGCDEHLKELIRLLRLGIESEKDYEEEC